MAGKPHDSGVISALSAHDDTDRVRKYLAALRTKNNGIPLTQEEILHIHASPLADLSDDELEKLALAECRLVQDAV